MSETSRFTFAEIVELHPPLNDRLTRYMLENFGVTLKLRSPHPAETLQVQLWTNAHSKYNSDGNWHAIDLPYQTSLDDVHWFEGGFFPTSQGKYEYTYRLRVEGENRPWQWLGHPQHNGTLHIKAPSEAMPWTQGPSCVAVLPRLYIGNYIAASQAEKLGVDAVLNMAEELTLTYPPDADIAYCQLGTPDGAQNPIEEELLEKAVRWIDDRLAEGRRKILINCRAGIGRSGSVMVAYCFAKNPEWTYVETVEFVWSRKPSIYPHRQLQESLERLFPRQGR
ncbi:dual specificity protein phosphatase family protein [Baaleninema sp.]|uniref:dual specificity protein phosphatase family protein n=1 Tax=Baaleninema sp. TaxID=3101197 RepID=UPI003CFDEBBF